MVWKVGFSCLDLARIGPKLPILRSLKLKKFGLGASVVLFLFLGASSADAGILASLLGFLGDSTGQINPLVSQENLSGVEINSQNLDLLESVVGQTSSSSPKTEIDQPIIAGSAILSETGPLGTSADLKDNQPPSDLISVYTVHPGDTLSGIAKMYNVSINTIRWSNNLKINSVIKPGDTLVILPVTGIQYTVQKGDTLKALAKKYNGDVEEIIAYNGLDQNKGLIAGNTIIIPNGEEGTVISPSQTSGKTLAKYRGPSYPGYYLRPIVGGRKTQGIHGNNAVDLAAPVGTPLYASAEGRVIIARTSGWNGGYGNYIVIAHSNGTQTVYGHCSRVYVSVGQQVKQGDQIGTVGNTGHSTGSHVHFEIRGAANPF